jgi:hypothetical protein
VRCAYSEAAGVPSTSLRRIALKPNHTTALHTDSAGTALIQCASLSCAEAAGAEISMAAIQSMAKYSSRFKAPPYSSCFRSRPMKGAPSFPGRELPATTITRHLEVFAQERFQLDCLPASNSLMGRARRPGEPRDARRGQGAHPGGLSGSGERRHGSSGGFHIPKPTRVLVNAVDDVLQDVLLTLVRGTVSQQRPPV